MRGLLPESILLVSHFEISTGAYYPEFTVYVMDPFMNGYPYSPKYYGLFSTVEIMDPYVNGKMYWPNYYGLLSTR